MADKFSTAKQRRWLIASAAVLLVALVLRLRYIDTTGIWSDQAFTLNTAMRWVNGGDMPLAANKSSVGFVNPPMIEYVYALALGLWGDVLSVALITMLSGMLALVVTAYGTYRLFGWPAAIAALVLYAVNPWSVFYSQLIWNQTMVPFFASVTLIYLLLYVGHAQKPWYLWLSFIAAGCMTQVHPASAPQIVAIGVVVLLFWRRMKLSALLGGGALFVLTYVPYLIYEYNVGWVDLQAIRQVTEQEAPVSIASLLVSLDLLRAQGIPHTMAYVPALDGLATWLFIGAMATALRLVWQGYRRPDTAVEGANAALVAALIWWIVPVLFYLRSQQHLQIYYMINQLPAHFILLGVAWQWWDERISRRAAISRRRHWARLGLAMPLLVLALGQIRFTLNAQDYRLHNLSGELQIRHVREGIQTVQTLAAAAPQCPVVLLADGHQVETSTLSLFREFTTLDPLLLADADESLPLPLPCAIYVDAKRGSRASEWLRTHPATAVGQVDLQENQWTIYHLDTGAAITKMIAQARQPATPPAWVNGSTLVAYNSSLLQFNQPFQVALLWQVTGPPPRTVYHIGVYLLDSAQQVFTQADGAGFDSIQWRTGDYYLTWFEMPAQPPTSELEYSLAVAFYTWPGIERTALNSGELTSFLEQITVSP